MVKFGKKKLCYYTEEQYYEGTINPENGADWNQSAPIDTMPTEEDFRNTVKDYLAWKVSQVLQGEFCG